MSGLKAATINTRGKKPCAYFQKGICAFGDKCQQDHSTSTPRRPRKDFQYIVGAEIQTDAASDGTIESIKSGIEAANDHPFNAVDSELPEVTSPPAASDRLATCVFFRRGNCKTEGCTFAHVAQEAKASDDVLNELPSSSPDGYEVNTNRKVVCRYYSTGTCKNGANCRFFHENTLENSSLVMSSPFPSVSASEDPATFDESSSKKAMDSRDFHSTNSERQDGEDVSTEASAPVNEGLNDGFSSLRSKGDFGKFTVERNGVSSYRHASIVPHLTHEEPEEKTFAHVSYPYVGSVIPHWSQYADPYADDTVPFCKLHAQGICNSSEKCHFRHTLTPKEYTTLFHDLQPNLWTLHPRNPRSPQSTKSYQIHAPTQDGEQAHPPKGLGPCKFFPSGMCRNGVDCPYEHVEPTSIPHLEHATITSRYQEQQESQTAPICKLFRRGWCIHGENCPFQQEESHYYRNTSKGSWNRWEEDGKQSNGSYNNGTRMCRYFLQGNCNRGPQCLYSHDDVDHALQSERRTDDKKLESLSSESDPPMNSEWLRSEGDDQGWGQSADDWGAWKTPEGDTDTKLQKSGHQTNDKAVALNDQDIKDDAVQDYVDNSDSWSKPWSTESFEPSQPRRSQKPCKYYGQGYCAKHDCMYMHINPSGTIVNASSFQDDSVIGIPSWRGADDEETNEELMLASPNEVPDVPKPIVEVVTQRTIFGCKVCFKHDTSMENVVTVTDSRIICLSNLPLDVTPSDIETLVMPSGQCQNTMSVEEDDNSCTIQVEFPREDQAANAVLLLNEQLYDSRLISARLSTYPSIEKMSPLENRFIKLSWLTPSITVWVLYDTITKAKAEATRLDGLIFSESMIHATFIKPERKQNHSYSVKLEGLLVHVEKQSIKELCSEATSVVMDGPTCKEPVSPLIRDFLAQFGLLQFDEIPLSKDVGRGYECFRAIKRNQAPLLGQPDHLFSDRELRSYEKL
ncbi:hypothetical protein BDQ17DRAFT_1352417 [Cyathus striatus]|nr:hypothetical protein BDQ17DRAFT_1352417 [Cyathus striatus]